LCKITGLPNAGDTPDKPTKICVALAASLDTKDTERAAVA
jgi:hypothetical protein